MKLILNTYIKRPLLWDLIICIVFCFALYYTSFKFNINFNITLDEFRSSASDLISTSISLAGFVLASLTIIVTFKDNITHKERSITPEEKAKQDVSGIEILFSSKHYNRIVGVFSWAAFIFLIIFLNYSILKVIAAKIPPHLLIYIISSGILLTTLTIFRSLLILYNVIKLQVKK